MATQAIDQPHSVSLDAVQRLGAELAWFRATGFSTTARFERFLRVLLKESRDAGMATSRLLSLVDSAALAITEESRRSEIAALAARDRRRAV